MKRNDDTLDLHGVRHAEVTRVTDEFLYRNMLAGTQEVKIVTGNSERMKSIVVECLKDYDMRWRTSFSSSAVLIVEMT